MALLFAVQFLGAQEFRRWIGVAPFADAIGGGNSSPESAYIGFEAASFLSIVFRGYPGVNAVSPMEFLRPMREWGISPATLADGATTDAFDLGHMLALDLLVAGSFRVEGGTLRLRARVIEVQSGKVLSSGTAEAPLHRPRYTAYRSLLAELTRPMRGFESAPGVDARIGRLVEVWSADSGEAAKAQAAYWAGDRVAARRSAERVCATASVSSPDLIEAAFLLADLSTAENRDPPAAAALRRLETNRALAEHAEDLAVYRSTLRVVQERLSGAFDASGLTIVGDPAGSVPISAAGDHMVARFPIDLQIAVSAPARDAVAAVFRRQDVVAFGPKGLSFAPVPVGPLLKRPQLESGLALTANASIELRIRFVDPDGATLFELASEPIEALSLAPASARFGSDKDRKIRYRTRSPRAGWRLLEDGSVEFPVADANMVRAVRFSLDQSSFLLQVGFPWDSDAEWRSLTAHAYRVRSVRTGLPGEESGPLRAAVLADRFVPSGDDELGLVPLGPRNDRLSGYSRLYGVVYAAENTRASIEATWAGAVSGRAVPCVEISAGPRVFCFQAPESNQSRFGLVEFSARSTVSGSRAVSVAAQLGNGLSWANGAEPNRFLVIGDRIVGDDGSAYAVDDGRSLWSSAPKGFPVSSIDGDLFLIGGSSLYRIDPENGSVLAETAYQNKGRIFAAHYSGDRLFVLSEFGGLESVDTTTGARRWHHRTGMERSFRVEGNRVYAGNGAALDAESGSVIFESEGRGAAVVADKAVIWENGACVDAENGRRLWRLSRVSGTPILFGDSVIFGGKTRADLADGTLRWTNDTGGDFSHFDGKTLYADDGSTLSAIDPSTGRRLWSCYTDRKTFQVAGGSLFDSLDAGGLVRRDLSILRRQFGPDEYDRRGSIAADVGMVVAGGALRGGVYIQNLVRGGGAEAAGLLPGDYLLAFGQRPLVSVDQVGDLALEYEAGDRVALRIARQDGRSGRWNESLVDLVLAPLGASADTGEPAVLRPGFRLGVIDAARLREMRVDRLARYDSYIVETVHPKSPAADAGLRVGDILLQVGTAVLDAPYMDENYKRLFSALAAGLHSGNYLSLSVIRDGERKTLPAFRP